MGRSEAIYEQLQAESADNRQRYERFYNSLALFSGGTLALSVTYLGYLQTLGSQPMGISLLFASWIFLISCLSTALFWSFFNAHFVHYARMGEYANERKQESDLKGDAVAAGKWKKEADNNKKKGKIYLNMWVRFGMISRISFLVGIALLLLFAIKNAEVSRLPGQGKVITAPRPG